MRLGIASDFQLGAGEVYATPTRTRLADTEDHLEQMADELEARDVTALLFGGDAFEKRKPGPDELLVFKRFANRLLDHGLELILCLGNHDLRGPDAPAILELFDNGDLLRVVRRPELVSLRAMDEGPDVLLGVLPWTHPAHHGGTPLERARLLVAEAARLRAQVAEVQRSDVMPVLLTHYALAGMRLPTGLSTGELIGEPVLDTHALLAQGWRYVFAGHVHARDVMVQPEGPRTAVSIGSPWTHDFGEAGESHGFYVLDVPTDHLDHVELEGRPFITLTEDDLVDVTRLGSDGLEYHPGLLDVAGAVVRVRVKLEAEGVLDVEGLKRALYEAGAHKVHAIELDRAESRARARVELAEETAPLEAVRAWCAATNASDSGTRLLEELTATLLREETPDAHAPA